MHVQLHLFLMVCAFAALTDAGCLDLLKCCVNPKTKGSRESGSETSPACPRNSTCPKPPPCPKPRPLSPTTPSTVPVKPKPNCRCSEQSMCPKCVWNKTTPEQFCHAICANFADGCEDYNDCMAECKPDPLKFWRSPLSWFYGICDFKDDSSSDSDWDDW